MFHHPAHKTKFGDAVAAATFLTNMNLFAGQKPECFTTLHDLAGAADHAHRQVEGEVDSQED